MRECNRTARYLLVRLSKNEHIHKIESKHNGTLKASLNNA